MLLWSIGCIQIIGIDLVVTMIADSGLNMVNFLLDQIGCELSLLAIFTNFVYDSP